VSIKTTTWKLDKHTAAKHFILKRYLEAWLIILSRAIGLPGKEVLFIDGFAGPGIYEEGEPGSPVIAAKVALDHDVFPRPVRMAFIEADKRRHNVLCEQIESLQWRAEKKKDVTLMPPIHGECVETLNGLLDDRELKRQPFGPALAFLDQFGYSDVPMTLVRRIMANDQCEILSYLSSNDMDRWIEDPTKEPAFQRAYDGDEWREAIRLPTSHERQQGLLNLYRKALKSKAGVEYSWSFRMCDKNDKPLYWLIFCTNNRRGLEEMKKAMSKVDPSGDYRFSDATEKGQNHVLGTYTSERLADDLHEELQLKTMTADAVWDYVLTETPAYTFKSALGALESQSRIKVKRPAGLTHGFPDEDLGEINIQFLEPQHQRELF
jgi:three-Cys-motif partner protein